MQAHTPFVWSPRRACALLGLFGALILQAQTTPAGGTAAPMPVPVAPRAGARAPNATMTDAVRKELTTAMASLAGDVAALKRQYAGQKLYDRIADVEIYLNAVKLAMEDAGTPNPYDKAGAGFNPFAQPNAAQARAALNTGKQRAAQLAQGQTPWMNVSSVRGYYSKIDGSAQPYQLTLPAGYDPTAGRQYRLDIFEHGRGATTSEMNFINGKFTAAGDFNQRPFAPDATRFILQPWGRWCNATRFAGEVDTLEAVESVKRAHPIDGNRIVMTGFSMGGASAWMFGTHHPDWWAAFSAGAGFTETLQYLHIGPDQLPPAYQQSLWHMYDSRDYALNVADTRVVAYSSASDPQKQAADVMEAAIKAEGYPMEYIIGIGAMPAHSYTQDARHQLMARLDALAAKGRDPAPRELHFTTWMLRYNQCFWVALDGMGQQWERARADAKVDGNQVTLTTSNISALHLDWAAGLAPFAAGTTPGLTVDGTTLTLPAVAADQSLNAGLVKTNGQWRLGTLPAGELHKIPGLQGPIDDAFMDSFMIVRPTGTAFNDAVGQWTVGECDRAILDWRQSFRSDARVKTDTEITAADIAANNLVLFGDPASNVILKRIAPRLPIKWTADGVTVGDQTYPAATSVPLMIFPNPLNPTKYVVLNSGFTFHDFSSNARMNPKLPDWAVVDITKKGDINLPTAAVGPAGFFDESWQLKGPAN